MRRRRRRGGGGSAAPVVLFDARDFIVAAGLGVLAFAAYLLTLPTHALPGLPSQLVAAILGAKPRLFPQHAVWGWLVQAAGAGREGIVFRVNALSAVSGAFSVALLYWLVKGLLGLALWKDSKPEANVASGRPALVLKGLAWAPKVGGAAAALALAFSLPFWTVSTLAYPHAFYVAWLLLSALALLRFVAGGSQAWAVLFALVHGAGMSQTSAFWTLAPLAAGIVLFVLWGRRRLTRGSVLKIAAAGFLGTLLILANAGQFYRSEGFAILGYGGFLQVVRMLLVGLYADMLGSLPRVGWMIVLGMTVAPWVVALTTGKRALNSMPGWASLFLHVVMSVLTLAVLIDIKASPWRLLGVSNATVVPYVLLSMTFGYLVAYFYVLPIRRTEDSARRGHPRSTRVARRSVLCISAALLAGFAWNNSGHANGRVTRFVGLYADTLLDSLEGRSWVVTNGMLDDVLLLRARERGIPLHCLSLAKADEPATIYVVRRDLKSIRLRNAAQLGLVPLVEEWIRSEPGAAQDLALCLLPDLWALGGYLMRPNRLVFLGATEDEWPADGFRDAVASHRAFWRDIQAAMDAVPASASPLVRSVRDHLVRPQVSFVGNNLGVVLETLGRREEAFEVFAAMTELDPGNVSALLNWATLSDASKSPEIRERIAARFEDFKRKLGGGKIPVWSLSGVFGYVVHPDAFAQLGWSWVQSGRPTLAVAAMRQAEAATPPQKRAGVQAGLAQLYLLEGDLAASELSLQQCLALEPDNVRALLGLALVHQRRGEFPQARLALDRAAQAGAPREQVALATAALCHFEGDTPRARDLLAAEVERAPKNAAALAFLCSILAEQKDLKALQEGCGRLEAIMGAEDPMALTARASRAVLMNDIPKARNLLLKASRAKPTSAALLEQVVRMDCQLMDRAGVAERARQLLKLDIDNGFGNYMMASLAIADRHYPEAEDYLRRSIAAGPTFGNLNDMAVVLLHRNAFGEAAERARQALALDGLDFAGWDTLGMILMAQRKFNEAEAAFRKALELSDDVRVHLHLAQLALLRGDRDGAKTAATLLAPRAQWLPPDDRREFEELRKAVAR